MPDLIAQSVDLERDRLLDAANAAFERLRSDPEAWAEETAEREAWDATLGQALNPSGQA